MGRGERARRERAAIKGRLKREPACLSLRRTLLSNPLATHPHVTMKNAAERSYSQKL